MKTLTVTIHHSTNYGATLQAYALQQVIKNLGHENVIFEYPYKNNNLVSTKTSTAKRILNYIFFNMIKLLRGNKTKKLQKSFAIFHEKRMSVTRIYESMEDLRMNPPKADAYITGSDQVWNFSRKNIFIPARLLDFGDNNIIRISYAASIEKLNYSDDEKEMVRRCLKSFSGISLREQSACDYISGITGQATVRVVDPVFLLSNKEWSKIAQEPRIKGPYILAYQVLRNERMQEVANYIKRITGYPIVQICNSGIKWIHADKTFFDVSPEEMIGFYMHASVVVSASFHGTALGLVFGKPTYGLVRNEFGSRIKEILEMFSLGHFCISQESSIPMPEINAKELQLMIETEKEKSLSYLKGALSK